MGGREGKSEEFPKTSHLSEKIRSTWLSSVHAELAKSIQFDNFSYFTKYIKNTIWMLSFKDIVKAKQTIKQGDIVTYGN